MKYHIIAHRLHTTHFLSTKKSTQFARENDPNTYYSQSYYSRFVRQFYMVSTPMGLTRNYTKTFRSHSQTRFDYSTFYFLIFLLLEHLARIFFSNNFYWCWLKEHSCYNWQLNLYGVHMYIFCILNHEKSFCTNAMLNIKWMTKGFNKNKNKNKILFEMCNELKHEFYTI